MILSVASAPSARSIEQGKASELFPAALRENAGNLIAFLESYYEYVNQEGLPSREINSITREHDIDLASAKYLDAIQNEIAKGVPNSNVLDRVSLYKKIVQYYSTRGSENSVVAFFRIFFDEFVEVFYPRDYLFATSSGSWDDANDFYRDRKGFTSDLDKIRDGFYWQEYSYEIRSSLNVNDWEKAFMRMVHPSGLKFFAAVLIELFRSNTWIGAADSYLSSDPDNETEWLQAFVPPTADAFHLPFFQPGWLSGNNRRIKVLLEAFLWHSEDANHSSFVRVALLALKFAIAAGVGSANFIRSEYQSTLKFLDSGSISSVADMTIEEAIAPLSNENVYEFSNISAIVTSASNAFSDGVVIDDGTSDSQLGWDYSSHENGTFPMMLGWNDSTIDAL